MNLRDLNNEYFELYGDLYQARALLTDKQYKMTADALLSSYKEDLEVSIMEKSLAVGRERFELRYKVRNWLPHRFLFFFWNKLAKRLLKQYLVDFEAELKRLEEATAPQPATDEEADQLPAPQ